MSKRPSRGVSSGVGSPMRMSGRDGDLTIRKTKEGKILYVKEHGSWHPINTGVDVAQMKKDVDRLIRSVNTLRNDNNPFPTINALNIRKNVATATVDPKITFTIAGTDKFTIGVDDSDSDKFKIDTGSAVGGATKVTLDSSGNLDVVGVYQIDGSEVLSKTALVSTVKITNSNIDANAIAFSKMEDLTGARVLQSAANGSVAVSSITSTTLGYLDATSSIQSQLDTKGTATAVASNTTHRGSSGTDHSLLSATAGTLTASKALVADSSSKLDKIAVDNLEFNGNTISSTDTNGNINLTPNGTGQIKTSNAIGFTHVTTDGGSTGDVTDVPIDFATSGNKYRLTFTGGTQTFTNVQLVFPSGASGNFTLIVKTHSSVSTNAITNYPVYNGTTGAAATVNAVVWPGGAKPTITNTAAKADIISFYWDSDAQAAYGVITQNFSV